MSDIVLCLRCGAKNRVPDDKVRNGLLPICGKCKAPLLSDSTPMIVTDASFAAKVERSNLPVLLDFWAPWCGPCRTIAPIIEQLARDMSGRVRFGKLNIDQNPSTAARFKVSSIPTLVILKNGREVDRIVGLQPAAQIRRRLDAIAGARQHS